ncbi:ATP-binding protein [Virgisporangium aurantiacum]|uniref:Sulfate transporter n=1 Tax=Virgisporangium aurantiacum TaxID=175570 RepID=A0A8J4E2Q1_9ACTN|nr:ATP-binding protein [Virgisporangium aurantiacum]GIJ59229.1 sulfate transporter [Virgisporangium aurantiacum]
MKCTFDATSPVAVITVGGELDLAGTAILRAAVLKCLAAQPRAVLIDAERLTVAAEIHLTALAAAARHAAGWPSIPVLLCAPSAAIAAAAHRSGIDRLVIICASLADGHRRVAQRTLPSRVSKTYPPVPGSVVLARVLVTDACRTWRLPDTSTPAEIIVAELMANVVRHARTPGHLVVSHFARVLRLAVSDRSPEPARLVGRVGPEILSGRGLLLVDTLATRWGCTPTADGKVTWATLPAR